MIVSNVNIGSGPGVGDGDSLYTAFDKVNHNFANVLSNVNNLTNSVTTVAGRTGNVVLTVNDIIGLSNAYAIASSTATANTAMRGYVDTKIAANIAALINGAPGALDTLEELAYALGNNASFSATIINSLTTTNSNLTTANTSMRGYVDGQIIAANSGISSAVTLANTGMKGYVDYTNSVQSTEIATANIGLKGYVDQANTIQSAQVGAANLAIAAANVGLKGYIDLANTIQSAQVGAANLAITAANVGLKGYVDYNSLVQSTEIANANVAMKGYVDQANSIQSAQIATANIGLKGYIDQANTIQSAQITTANLGIIGYIDQANTIQSGQVGAANLAIIAANLGMKGYVDSVASLSIYSNVNVKAYTESMGYQNYGNVNVAAYVTSANSAVIGYIDQANTIQSAQISAANVGIKGYVDQANSIQSAQVGAANLAITAANLGMKGYVDSQSFYSNTKVATYLQAGNISNVSVAGNVTATYFVGNGALLTGISGGISSYSNVQVATYLPTYSGNVANVRLGTSGILTFADGTTQITAASGGGSSYSNVNVAAYLSSVSGNIIPSANVTYSLGDNTHRWKDLYLSGTTIFLGATSLSADATTGAIRSPVTRTLYTQSFLPGTANSANTYTLAYSQTPGSTVAVLVIGQQSGGPAPSYYLTEGVDFTISGLVLIVTASYTATSITCYETYIDTGDLLTTTEISTETLTPPSGNLTVDGDLIITGDLTVSPTSIYMGNLRISAVDGNLTVNTGIKFSDNSVQNTAYSNVKVAAYLNNSGYNLYSNVNVAAYLNNNGTVPIGTTSTIYANAGTQSTSTGTGALVVTGGAGISGNLTVGNLTVLGTQTTVNATSVAVANSFIFLSNNNITNVLDIGFVGQYNAGQGNVYTGLAYHAADTIYRLFTNLTVQPSTTINVSQSRFANLQLGNLIAANIIGTIIAPSQGYITTVGNLTGVTASGNITTTGYLFGNGSQLAGIVSQNYVDGQITAANAGVTTANTGMKGYVDAVSTAWQANAATQSDLIIGINANVTAANTARTTGNAGIKGYVDQQIYIVTTGYGNANTGLKGYVDSLGFYSNVQTATYLRSGNIANISVAGNVTATYFLGNGALLTGIVTGAVGTNYSNVNVQAYTESMGFRNYGNSNVASYLATYSGNIANVRLGVSGVLTFPDGTTQITAGGGGGSNYGNANVTAYTVSMGFTNFSNVNVAALITTNGLTNYSNANVQSFVTTNGLTNYSNVNVAAYLGTGQITAANVKLAPSGNITFADGTAQTSAYSNVNLIANLRVSSVTVGNLTVLGALNTTLDIGNSFVSLATNNIGNTNDIGFYGQYNAGQGNVYTGLAYTASDGIYRLYSNLTPEPSTTITLANIRYSNIQVGNILAANVTVNSVVASNVYVNGNIIAGNATIAGIVLTNNSIYSSQTGVDIQFGSLSATANIVMNRNVVHNRDINVIGNVIANNISILGNITGNVNGYTIGYRDVPQITVANLTLIASDAGKHYYGSNTNPTTITIPLNSSVAFGNGTAISIINQGTGNITIANVAGVQLYLAGNATGGSRTLTSYGMATLLKVQVNTWFINGTGVV